MASTVTRYTAGHPCPVCGGHEKLPRGQGRRCIGFLSSDGQYAHCSRGGSENHWHEGSITWSHVMTGPCDCGSTHGDKPTVAAHPKKKPGIRWKLVATYDYRDEQGGVLFQVQRLEGTDDDGQRHKSFPVRRPDAQGSAWLTGLGDTRKVLYNLPTIPAAIASGTMIYVTEGEKDATSLTCRGLVATCNPFGAGKWIDDYSESLCNADVVVILDNDEPGRKHADAVIKSLQGKAKRVRRLELPGAKDVTEWFLADPSHTVEALQQLVAGIPAPDSGPFYRWKDLLTMQHAVREPVLWPLAFRGTLTEVTAFAKGGKSTLLRSGLAHMLRAEPFLGRATKPTSFVYLTEESEFQLAPAALESGLSPADALADETPAFFVPKHKLASMDWPARVELGAELCRQHQSALLVVDTLVGLSGLEDENNASQVHAILEPLVLAAARGLAVVYVRHMGHRARKEKDTPNAASGRGSTAFGAIADHLVTIRQLPKTPKHVRLLAFDGRLSKEVPAGFFVQWSRESGYSRIEAVSEAEEITDGDANEDEIMLMVVLNQLPIEPSSALTLTEILARSQLTCSRKTLQRKIQMWREAGDLGQIEPDEERKKARYYRLKPS